MKKLSLPYVVMPILFAVAFTACQKEESDKNISDEIEATTHNDDESRFSNEIDAIAGDANVMLGFQPAFAGRGEEIQSLICDANVLFDSLSNPKTITITYNGSNCLANRTRTGVVILSMPQNTKWKDSGAVVTITFQNLKITRLLDNKSITINGTKTITNQTGGLLISLPSLNSITHLINSSGLSVTFDNGTQRSWQVARKHLYTYNNGVILTLSGNHSENGMTNISEWGTNRFGRTFYTSTPEPIVIRQDCSFRVTSGQVKHELPNFMATTTFGLNAEGNATTCPGSGSYYYNLTWTGPSGNSKTLILPY